LIPQVYAQSDPLMSLMGRINKFVVNPLIVLMFSVALVLFVFGLFNFFGSKEDTEALAKGKSHMLWGIVGMAIMVSVFGIMNFITGTIGLKGINPATTGSVDNLVR